MEGGNQTIKQQLTWAPDDLTSNYHEVHPQYVSHKKFSHL